jgi:fructose-specific component phosphotransferase system IIB-like protein
MMTASLLRKISILALAAGYVATWCVPTYAQQTNASLVGNVTNTSAAVVVGAEVTVTNPGTNTSRVAVTDNKRQRCS